MATVIVSDDPRDQLASAGGPVELVNTAGRAVGRAVKYVRLCGVEVPDDFPTDADIDRELAAGRSHTADQSAAWFARLKESVACA